MGPMLLSGAGIYMVRGGGSCGGKHRVVTSVRHWRLHGAGAQEGPACTCLYTHKPPQITPITYTHTLTWVLIQYPKAHQQTL